MMVALVRKISHPRPPLPMELDFSSCAWRQHPLTPDVAMILPSPGSSLTVRDRITTSTGTAVNLTHTSNPVIGLADVYNGSSSYTDFGTSSQYAITTGEITIAIWFKSTGWGTNCPLLSRRYTSGPTDDLNYLVTQTTSNLAFAYTTSSSAYHIWQSTDSLAALGAYDNQWHLLVASWTFGSFSNLLATLDGKAIAGGITLATGADGNHVPSSSQHMVLGANWGTAAASFANASLGLTSIYRRKFSLALQQQLWLPQTRWAMLPVRRSRRWFIPSAPPGPSLVLHRRRPTITHPGSRSVFAC